MHGTWSHLSLIFKLLHSVSGMTNSMANRQFEYHSCNADNNDHWIVMLTEVMVAKMMKEKFEFLFLEAVCLIRSFIVQIVFPKNDLSEVSWWGIYGLRGRKTINCFCQTRTRAFRFHRLLCFNQTPRRRC